MNRPLTKPWVVFVGGFLGSGKTTLILAAAQELQRRGMRSAIILNDQGEALVDTQYAILNGRKAGEVTGGCFCCRFSNLIDVMRDLHGYSPEVIFAEPVGSCADISATVLRPLLEHRDEYRLAPLTVLVDPQRSDALGSPEAEPGIRFLFQKQLQEADLVCVTKSDLLLSHTQVTAQHLRQVSAKTGQGVAAWLDEVLSGNLSAGREVLDIDYEQYAQAEAALAWLNLQVKIELDVPRSPAAVLGPLLDRIDAEFTKRNVSIVHLKAMADSPTGFVKAAICFNGQEPVVEGVLAASPCLQHELLLNLRAQGHARQVREVVEEEIYRINGSLSGFQVDCFHPAAPKPERRR